MSKKVSIILPLYDSSKLLRRFTMNALKCIRENTDPELYELIIIDNKTRTSPYNKEELTNLDYHGSKYLDINENDCKIIYNDPDIGYYKSMNQAAKIAEGKYLCFTQNDVMVPPQWLENLTYYLDNDMADAICPDMMPHGRKWRLEHDAMSLEQNMCKGCIEAGTIIIKREAFDKVGGWLEDLWQEIGWGIMFYALGENGYRIRSSYAVPVVHINQASRDGLQAEGEDKYQEYMKNDHVKSNEWMAKFRDRHGIVNK